VQIALANTLLRQIKAGGQFLDVPVMCAAAATLYFAYYLLFYAGGMGHPALRIIIQRPQQAQVRA
jgi:hypothetical protein